MSDHVFGSWVDPIVRLRQIVSGYYDDVDDGYLDRRRCTGMECTESFCQRKLQELSLLNARMLDLGVVLGVAPDVIITS